MAVPGQSRTGGWRMSQNSMTLGWRLARDRAGPGDGSWSRAEQDRVMAQDRAGPWDSSN